MVELEEERYEKSLAALRDPLQETGVLLPFFFVAFLLHVASLARLAPCYGYRAPLRRLEAFVRPRGTECSMLACAFVMASLIGDGTVLHGSILSSCWRVVRLIAHGRWRPWPRLQPGVLLSWIVLKYCQNRGTWIRTPRLTISQNRTKNNVVNIVVFNGTKIL